MFHLYDTIAPRELISIHVIQFVSPGDSLYIFHQTTETSGEGFHVSCRNHLHLQNHGWTPIEIALVFRAPLRPHFLLALLLSSLRTFSPPPPFLSMLDASIEILLACSFEWFEVLKRRSITRHSRVPKRTMPSPRKTETRMTKVTKARGKLLAPGELPIERLDANRPASFDGLSVQEEASRSAKIYRDCIRHRRL